MRFEERYVINDDITFMIKIGVDPNEDDKNVTDVTLWWESEKDPQYTYVPHNKIEIGYGIAVESEMLRIIGCDIQSVVDEIKRMVKTHLNEYSKRNNIRCTRHEHDEYLETIAKHITAIIKHIL